MLHQNCTWNSSDGPRELSPIDIVYISAEITSELCLLIVILTYSITRRRNTVTGILMINFCLSLFLLYLESICNTFVWTSGSKAGCVALAVLGHWFFLAMLTAIAAYALLLHLKLVLVFSEEPRHFVAKTIVVTWVFPLLVAVICVAADHHQYNEVKHMKFCSAKGFAFYIGIVLPAMILLLFSTLLMTLSVRAVCNSRHSDHIPSETDPARRHTDKLKRRMRLFLCLLIMATLGWGSALVASDDNVPSIVRLLTAIPYLVCSLGQGVFIFLFVCVFNSNVRKDWWRVILSLSATYYSLGDRSSCSVQTASLQFGGNSRNINSPATPV